MTWPAIEPIRSARALLEPLTLAHAAEMAQTLADPSLYEFIGGQPPTLEQLRRQYRAQAKGQSEGGGQWWLNWIVTLTRPRRAVGYVQATVEQRGDQLEADIAWVIAPAFQGRGLATEATAAMVGWLTSNSVDQLVAYIHPDHATSAAVARSQGLHPTDVLEDGEIRWRRD